MKKVRLPFFTFLFFFCFFFQSFNSHSQTSIQAGVFLVNNNEVDIRVKPNADINALMFTGHFSFTVKCANTAGTAFINPASVVYITNPYGFSAPVVTSDVNFIYLSFDVSWTPYKQITWLNNTENSIVRFKIAGGAGRTNFYFEDNHAGAVPLEITLTDTWAGTVYYLTPAPLYRYYQQSVNNVPLGLVADFGIPTNICEAYNNTDFSNQSIGTTLTTTYSFDFDGAGSTYLYNSPNTNFNVVNSVIYANTTPTQVTLKVTDGLLTDEVTKSISINPLPTPPTAQNTGSVCVGDNIFLTANYIPNATYNWFGPGSYTSNIQNPSAILATNAMVGTPQTYGVTATVHGCTSGPGWAVVYVNAPITIDAGNNITVCQNGTANLSGSVGSGGTGVWHLVSSPIPYTISDVIPLAQLTNPTASINTGIATGTYILEFENTTTNTCAATDQVTVTINPAPGSPSGQSNSPVCEGGSINLTVNSPQTGLIYEWTGPGSWHATGTTVTRAATTAAAGSYFLYASNSSCTVGPYGPVAVTVNSLPTADAGSNVTIQCTGTTAANLSGSVTGGTAAWSLLSGPSGTIITNLIASSDITNPLAPINTSAPLGNYTLRLTATSSAGCTVYDDVTVELLQNIPSTPSFVATSPVCEGGTITLTVNTPKTGEFYQWNGPAAWTATGTMVSRVANSTATGNYTLTASNGTCSSVPSAPVSVNVNLKPTVDAGSNITIQCVGTTTNSLTGSVSGGSVAWSLVSGPSGALITNLISSANLTNPTAPLITSAPLGNYTLRLTATSVNGCTAYDDVTVLILNNIPATPVATVTTPVCIGSPVTLAVSGPVTGLTYQWSGPNSYNATGSSIIFTSTSLSAGSYTVTASNGTCNSAPSTAVSLVVNPLPTVDAGQNVYISCQGTSASLSGSISGGTGTWTLASGPSGTLITNIISSANINNPTAALITSAPIGTYTVQFNAVTVNGCTAYDQATVTIANPAPIAPSATSNTPLCEGGTINLSVIGPVTGQVYSWSGPSGYSATGSTITRAATLTAGGSYTVTASLGACNSVASLPVTVTVNPLPVVDAGTNVTIQCQGTAASLSGSVSGGTGTWSLVSGPSGTLITNVVSSANINNPTAALITSAPLGTYLLRFTATTVNSCTAFDDVQFSINHTAPSIPSGVSNSPICDGGTIILTVNTPKTGETYEWAGPNSYHGSGSSLTRPANSTTAGNYTITASNGTCTSGASSAIPVTVNPAPIVDAGSNVTIQCQGTAASLSGSISGGTGTWTLVSGPSGTLVTNVISSANISNPVAPLITSAPLGNYTLRFTATTVNGCTAYDDVTVTIVQTAPSIPSGVSNSPICDGGTIILTVNTPKTGETYEWSGPNSFHGTGSSLSRPANSNTAGNYTITATNGTCTSAASSAISVTVNPLPIVDAGNNVTVQCQGTAASLSGSISGGTGAWTLVSGPAGTILTNVVSSANVANPVAPLITSAPIGTYSLRFTATTVNGCMAYDDVQLSINHPSPTIPSGVSNSPICDGGTIALTVNGPKSGETYQWSGPNSFHATGSTITRLASSYTAGSYTITASNGTCTSASSAAISVVVNPLPIVDAGPSVNVQCQGTAANLSGSVSGGTAYWSLISGPSGTLITNLVNIVDINNPNASLNTTSVIGNYLLQFNATTANGCISQDQVTVSINHPQPAIPSGVSNSPICDGGTIILTVNTPRSGEIYQWNGPGSWNSTGSTVSRLANTVANGNYTITASNGTCTSGSSAPINVVVNPLPTAEAGSNVTVHCQGVPASLSGSLTGGTGTWSLVSGPAGLNVYNLISVANINNPTAPLITTSSLGTYQLRFTVVSGSGCVAFDEVEVNIEHPTPGMPVASLTTPVCEGSPYTLTVNGAIAGLTYEWFGPGAFRASGSSVVRTATLASAGDYTVIAGNGMCNSPISSKVTLVVNPMPAQPVAWNNSPVCQYDTLKLFASTIAGATYRWTGPNTYTSNVQNPTIPDIQTNAAGIYWVTTSIGNCSADPVSTVVFIKPSPNRGGYITTNSVCDGDKLVVKFNYYDSKATYFWKNPSHVIFSTDTNAYTINYSRMADSGLYSVYMKYSNGCTSPAIFGKMIVNPVPLAPVVGNQITKCALDTIYLKSNAIAGASYYWSGPGSFVSSLQNPDPIIASTATEGVYNLYVKVKGCNSPVSKVLVTTNPLPATPVLVTNGPLCWGADLVITVTNPLAGGNYVWTHPDKNHAGGNVSTSSVPQYIINSVNFSDSGIYKAKVIGSRCTSLTGFVKLVVNPLPDATITPGGPTEFCKNDSVTISAPSGLGYTYLWSTKQITQSIVVKTQGWFYVTVTTAAGCKSMDSIYITVWELPIANAGPDVTISKGFSTQLHGSGGITYQWSVVSGAPITSLDDPTKADPIASPLITTTYMLIVGNEHGCLDTDFVTVFVLEDYILDPTNLITANGDGVNDVWYVGNIVNYPDNKVMIFNRFGDKIYEVKGYANTWTGEGYPNGTYYYVIIFDKSSKIYKGTITVIDKK